MSASSFGGLWTYPSITHQDHNDFMFIDEDRRRIITFVVFIVEPLERASIRSWYQPESDTAISATLRPTKAWHRHEFELKGDELWWNNRGAVQEWQRVPWELRPGWLDEGLAMDHAKMDAIDEGT